MRSRGHVRLRSRCRVTTPVIDGLIALSGATLGQDFVKEGRTLESLGLAGKSVEAIKRIFEIGPTAWRSRWSGVN